MMPLPTEKRCSKCNQMLPASDFNRDATSRYGLKCCCRDCQNKADRARNAANKAAGVRRIRKPRKPKPALLSPLQPMAFFESMDCDRLARWRGPVNNEPLRARL